MVAFFCPPPFMGKKAANPLTIENGGFQQTPVANQNPSSFTNCAIGAASADRWVIVFAIANSSGSIASATIGGVSATVVSSTPSAGGQGPFVTLIAKVDAGTTATISITWNSAPFSAAIMWAVVRGNETIVVNDSGASLGTSTGAKSFSMMLAKSGATALFAYGSTAASTASGGVGTLTTFNGTPFGASGRLTIGQTTDDLSATISNASAVGLFAVSLKPI